MSHESALAQLNTAIKPGGTQAPVASPTAVVVSPDSFSEAPETVGEPQATTELESTKFTALAKREQALVKEREALKREKDALESERARVKEVLTPFEQFKVLKEKDPVEALKNLGFSETDIVNFLAAEKKEPTMEEKAAAAAKGEIENFRKEQAEKESKVQAEKNIQLIKSFENQITNTITKEADKFEYCNFYGKIAEAQIMETVQQVLIDTGDLISAKEAAQMVEDMYEAEDKAMSERIKKRKPLVPEPVQVIPDAPLKPSVAGVPPKPKSLTNAATATVATTVNRKETSEQKRARLEEALRSGVYKKA